MPSVSVYRSLAEDHLRDVHPEPNTGCWLWAGCATKSGYGMIAVPKERGKPFGTGAHRVFYQSRARRRAVSA